MHFCLLIWLLLLLSCLNFGAGHQNIINEGTFPILVEESKAVSNESFIAKKRGFPKMCHRWPFQVIGDMIG